MLYFQVDPRDGGPSGAACNTCCCQSVTMRPGETNRMTIDYAAWALPIAPPGLVRGGFEYSITEDDAGCAEGAIDGAAYPANANMIVTNTPRLASVEIDLTDGQSPAGSMDYALVPLSGPYNGSVVVTAAGEAIYQPAQGFDGYDYFSFRMCDLHGRCVTRTVQVYSGNAAGAGRPQPGRMSLVPFVDIAGVQVDDRMQTVSFPVYMPLSCRGCEVYRMQVKMRARDCDGNVYEHLACFDFRCKACG